VDARPGVAHSGSTVADAGEGKGVPVYFGMLSRDSSLIDLAMIPPVETPAMGGGSTTEDTIMRQHDATNEQGGMAFVDFPHFSAPKSEGKSQS